MKIVVDVKRIVESYIPDTEEFERVIEFSIGGALAAVVVTEEQLAVALMELQTPAQQDTYAEGTLQEAYAKGEVVSLGPDSADAVVYSEEGDVPATTDAVFTTPEEMQKAIDEGRAHYTEPQGISDVLPEELGVRTAADLAETVRDIGFADVQAVYGESPEVVEAAPRQVAPTPQEQRKKNIKQTIAKHTKKTPRQELIARMREKAQSVPRRRVPMDEMGYPRVASKPAKPQHTGVEVKRQLPAVHGLGGASDDDGFPSA